MCAMVLCYTQPMKSTYSKIVVALMALLTLGGAAYVTLKRVPVKPAPLDVTLPVDSNVRK